MNLLPFIIEGNEQSPPLVFIHGWPDTAEVWTNLTQKLSSEFRCIRLNLPLYQKTEGFNPNGYDFPDVVDLIHSTIESIIPGQTFTLVGHDWGAVMSYLYENKYPNRVLKLITLDVGYHVRPTSIDHALFLISYQCWLAMAWSIGRRIPLVGPILANGMTRLLARLAHAPHIKFVHYQMNYFYHFFWRSILIKKYRKSIKIKRPQCPHLFLYGQEKRYMFHSKAFEQDFKDRKGWKIEGIPNANHWIMLEQPKQTYQIIRNWLISKE